MNGSELKQIRDLLEVGSVEFIEKYLGAKYHTGKKWLSDEIETPGPVEKCALLWAYLHNEQLKTKAFFYIHNTKED